MLDSTMHLSGTGDMNGQNRDVRTRLTSVGLRPTRQRLALAELLFSKGDRHVSAEGLHEEAIQQRVPVSLATVYNTLHQFTEAGLLREVAVDGSKTYFDTNLSDHHHYFIEGDNQVVDIPTDGVTIDKTSGTAGRDGNRSY